MSLFDTMIQDVLGHMWAEGSKQEIQQDVCLPLQTMLAILWETRDEPGQRVQQSGLHLIKSCFKFDFGL